jgi:predicted nucleic acid-binding protein
MNLVIDTNVLVESISVRSPYHKIFRSIIEGTNADLIVTSDHHFNVLKGISFPKVEIISPEEFSERFL